MNAPYSTMGNTAAEAFSKQADVFDAIDAADPMIGWVRDRVRAQALRHMRKGDRLLELNSGTGIDSAWFAEQGMRVTATDIAPGMVAQQLLKQAKASSSWRTIQCSYLELDRLGAERYDHVFSNFGGLNCTDRLDLVLNAMERIILPGGTCTLVIMPRICPWEMAAALKGNFGLARRRFERHTNARIEGVDFPCHYYSARYVRQQLGAPFEVIDQRGLSVFAPPPQRERFLQHWPRLSNWLMNLDDRIATYPPFHSWGDHFVITLRKR